MPLDPQAKTGVGETLPLYAGDPPELGDSADINGAAAWSEGYWTLEISRALQTASPRDVQLDPARGSQSFGLALWNGSFGDQHQVATLVGLRFTPRLDSESNLPQPQN
jgi:hypothetical protein